MHHAALAHRAGFTTLRRTVPDGSFGQDQKPLAEAIANGTRVNFGGVGIGAGGERVRCWALDDFQLTNVSLLKIDAVWSSDRPTSELRCCWRLLAGLQAWHSHVTLQAMSVGSCARLIMADANGAGLDCA